jgi:hypothetical protein
VSDLETRFHETWLGLVQPTEGLVVSVPVLTDALCMARQAPEVQERVIALSREAPVDDKTPSRVLLDVSRFFAEVLLHPASHFEVGEALPAELSLYVPEGQQTLRPTRGLLADPASRAPREVPTDASPAVRAGARYVALVWEVPDSLALDRPESVTGPWEYPLSAKLERLLRHCRVPIGILTNGRVIRLVYAPHGESSGHIDFRVDHLCAIDGRPILDALVMLLGAFRFYAAGEGRTLPELLAASRKRQADVTNDLAEQVFDAIQILLRGFEVAAERDGSALLRDAVAGSVEGDDDHVYGGLLTVLLRLVFVLYAEDWSLLPVHARAWAEHYSVLGLFEQLEADHGSHPDAMSRRFGAWGRLVALFRAIYLGLDHTVLFEDGDKKGEVDPARSIAMPPRRGHLFDPARFPFLEGWPPAGGAPILDPEARAAVRVPSVDDATVHAVLTKLVLYRPEGSDHGQRLSYRALDVEQLGSVYEGLMGYHVVRLERDAVALKVKNKRSAARAWVEVETLLEKDANRRAAWLEDEIGFDKANARKVVDALKDASRADLDAAREALLDVAAGKSKDKRVRLLAAAGRLVLQPGPERRRTSSHYTPRELSAPIVRRTLEPLLAVMGEAPSSERILNLKVCDPAMGSGAFLVEACRYLADEVVKAWAREDAQAPSPASRERAGVRAGVRAGTDPVLAARRLVAQRCLYGVDKNAYAVDLAKLSLWLVTLAKDHPFTFLDHALRHGDSLVGLDFDQIRAGHWKPGKQVELAELTLREALEEAIAIRQEIVELAEDTSPAAQRLKETKLSDAEDALGHARLLADLVVGAFFAHDKDKDREAERKRRIEAFAQWKASGDTEVPEGLLAQQRALRARVPAFHWMLEFPEVFYAERPDPLDDGQVNRAAYMDAFVGNPPFAGKNGISEANGDGYIDWLMLVYAPAHGNADLSAYFFRRTASLLGAHGSVGLISTNTIAQGDTRDTGLREVVAHGAVIHAATTELVWPGDAAVVVAVVHFTIGHLATSGLPRTLNDRTVPAIDSRLRPSPERPDPQRLHANANTGFAGAKLFGQGFVLSSAERDELVQKNPHNADHIQRYIGGEEVNNLATLQPTRFVINLGHMELPEAENWPDLVEIARVRVKPERDSNKRSTYQRYWWRLGETGDALYSAIGDAPRCLVLCQVSRSVAFAWQASDTLFAHTLCVFALADSSSFAALQSRIHGVWARLLSSSMKSDLRYAPSDCFETFPFPRPDPRTVLPALEDLGQRLYDARANYMLDEQVGLTITYNRLKDPTVDDPRIVALRSLHEELDAAVLREYGWSDIPVPPFCIATEADKKALEAFENEVIDRLFALNAKRAEEERVLGEGKPAKGKAGGKKAGGETATRKGKPEGGGGQGSLF